MPMTQEFFEKGLYWANAAYLVFVGLAAAASVAVFFFANHVSEIQKVQIATAQQKAAEANARAEEERTARIRIEERLAPRVIAPERRDAFVSAMHLIAGKPVFMDIFSSDPDSLRFGHELADALRAAGGNIEITHLMAGNPGEGTIITFGVNRESDALVLANALVAAGINRIGITLRRAAPNQADLFMIKVGVRP